MHNISRIVRPHYKTFTSSRCFTWRKNYRAFKKPYFFVSLDIQKAFNYVLTKERARKILLIVMKDECFEFLGSPMGLINTPMHFPSAMVNKIICKITNSRGTVIYENDALQILDDTLLSPKSSEGYFHCMDQLLTQVERKGL